MNKTFKSILSVIMCAMLVLSVSVTAFGAGLSGLGTKTSPYLVSSASDFDIIAEMIADGDDFSGKYISLQKNVTVSDDFVPLGTEETPFKGVFMGNGYRISGFFVDRNYAGMFAFTDGAEISSLTVAGEFNADDYAGSIVAYAVDTVIEGCVCAASVYAYNYCGGIAGYIESGEIKGCKTNARTSIGGYLDYCGGIAGFSGALIEECTNNAYVYGVKNVGGIAGSSAGDIIFCTNSARVEATSSNYGGIAGMTEGAVKYSRNAAAVNSSGANVGKAGGIAGVGYGAEIVECISAGNVTATGNYAGGIAGYLTNSDVTDCIAAANVTSSADYAGGIFGYSLTSDITRCIALSAVSAKSVKGGIGALSAGTVTDCYYNSSETENAIGTGAAAEVTAITDAEVMNTSVYTKLDFEKVWTTNTVHASYPLPANASFHNLTVTSETEPGCDTDGAVTSTCSVCQQKIVKVIPAFGHSMIVTSSSAATCLTDGYTDSLCTVCSQTQTVDIPATGHTDENDDNKCDTCEADLRLSDDGNETGFLQKLIDFINMIIAWFRSIFG